MPKKLEDCVSDVMKQQKKEGKSTKDAKSAAYAICAKSTGWVRKKGGGWRKKEFHESSSAEYKIEQLLQEALLYVIPGIAASYQNDFAKHAAHSVRTKEDYEKFLKDYGKDYDTYGQTMKRGALYGLGASALVGGYSAFNPEVFADMPPSEKLAFYASFPAVNALVAGGGKAVGNLFPRTRDKEVAEILREKEKTLFKEKGKK